MHQLFAYSVFVSSILLVTSLHVDTEDPVEDLQVQEFKRSLLEETEDALSNIHTWLYPEVSDHDRYKRSERTPQSLKQLFSHTSTRGASAIDKVATLMERHAEISKRNLVSMDTPSLRMLCDEIGFGTNKTDCTKFQKYRTIDGSCNNLDNVHWGQSMTPMPRYLPPDYADGINDPRELPSPKKLPNPRLVSSTVVHEVESRARQFTTLMMHFGQFLDHDLGHSPEKEVECHCQVSDDCFPIKIPDNDPFFSSLTCLDFHRSTAAMTLDCKPGPRQQINQITSFLDLSSVYASDLETLDGLRIDAYLKSLKSPRGEEYKSYLPLDEDLEQCVGVSADIKCLEAGDLRTAEQPGLTAMHTIFMRQHNFFAKTLHDINPHWKYDVVFEEARRINYAVWQRVVYNEFLPVILGQQAMIDYDLKVFNDGYFFGYSPKVDPSTSNIFSHAAFRFGHSFIPSELKRVNHEYEEVYPPIPLKEVFFNATHLFDYDNGGMDSIVLGMLTDQLSNIDTFIDDDVTKHLFATPAGGLGMDLVALNIQRGRDHGLPAYNEWRFHCGFPKAKTFEDLIGEVSEENIKALKSVYESVDDIDPFIGFISETPIFGALVGKTLGCIIGKQFKAYKFGDRFWHENGNGKHPFTIDQLNEIRKMTMARILCETIDDIETVQPLAFEVAEDDLLPGDSREENGYTTHGLNKRVPCEDYDTIPTIRLHHWIEPNEPLVEIDYKSADLRKEG